MTKSPKHIQNVHVHVISFLQSVFILDKIYRSFLENMDSKQKA